MMLLTHHHRHFYLSRVLGRICACLHAVIRQLNSNGASWRQSFERSAGLQLWVSFCGDCDSHHSAIHPVHFFPKAAASWFLNGGRQGVKAHNGKFEYSRRRQIIRSGRGHVWHQSENRRWRACGFRRSVGLRKVNIVAHDRRARRYFGRHDLDRRKCGQ